MEGSPESESTARRLSSENWKIFESWKKERRNLKDFQANYVRSHTEIAEDKSGNEFGLHCDSESVSSCGHTACLQLSFSDDASRYESCLETARSSLPVIPQEDEDELNTISEYFHEFEGYSGETWYERATTKSPEINETFAIKTNHQNIERFETEKEESLKSLIKKGTRGNYNRFIENHNTKLTAAVNCLLSIEPLKKYFRGIIYHSEAEEDDITTKPSETFATLEYVVKVFKKTRRLIEHDTTKEIQRLANEYSLEHNANETCFEKLKEMLSKLHEEIILAKHHGKLKRTCLRRCRLSNRSNHSIVSHIFRGHLKKKAECPCGHKNVLHDPFTSIPLFTNEFDEKTLVIPMTRKELESRITITKYLITINQHTTIKDLKAKLSFIEKTLQTNHKSSQITIASVKFNDIQTIHDASTRAFDAMCVDGELHAFIPFDKKEHCIQEEQNKEEEEDEFIETSTPALTDESCEGAAIKDFVRKEKRVRVDTTKVALVFRDETCTSDDRTVHPPVFIKLPKTAQGREISKCVQKVLDLTEMEQKKIFTTVVDAQTDACLVCCETNCNGCYLQSRKNLNMTENCKIVAYIPPNMDLKGVKLDEHKSLATGMAANVFTIEEGIAAFCNEDDEINCNACGINQFVLTTKTVISYPDILVLTIDREFSADKDILFPYTGFSPMLSRTIKNRKHYDLSGLITSNSGYCSSFETGYLQAKDYKNDAIKKEAQVEILIYTNTQYDERRRVKKAVSAMKGKRKGRWMPHDSNRIQEIHPIAGKINGEYIKAEEDECVTKDDDTVSTCNCSRCQCWQKCAEQIRSNENSSSSMTKVDEEFKALKEKLSPTPNLAFQLQRAIFKQDLRRVVSLLKKGANPNELVNGSSALHIAAGLTVPAGYLLSKLLIDHGADVNLKSALGQTAIQFAASFARSETVRLLGYHGADLSEADKIDVIRNAMNCSSIARETAITPNDSPLAKRYFDDSCNQDDALLQTMINLKKSIGFDHHILDGPKNLAENTEQLRSLGVKAITEKLYPNHPNNKIEIGCDAENEPLLLIDTTDDLRVSDLSVGIGERHLNSQHVTDDIDGNYDESDGHDETDDIQNAMPSCVAETSSPKQRLKIAPNTEIVGCDLSAQEEDNVTIEYMPRSHINTTRRNWFRFLCCGAGSRGRRRSHRRWRLGVVRNYLRMIRGRFSQWFNTTVE